MKNYKLINSGNNGNLYYAMESALDELWALVNFADRVYVIDTGKNLIWDGKKFVEDITEDRSGGSDGGPSDSSDFYIINGSLVYNEDTGESVFTSDVTGNEIANAITSGKIPVIAATAGNDSAFALFMPKEYSINGNNVFAMFELEQPDGDGRMIATIQLSMEDNTCHWSLRMSSSSDSDDTLIIFTEEDNHITCNMDYYTIGNNRNNYHKYTCIYNDGHGYTCYYCTRMELRVEAPYYFYFVDFDVTYNKLIYKTIIYDSNGDIDVVDKIYDLQEENLS